MPELRAPRKISPARWRAARALERAKRARADCNVAPHRYEELARYNSERSRGVVHTKEHQARMAVEQDAFDREQRQRLAASGFHEMSPGLWVTGPIVELPSKYEVAISGDCVHKSDDLVAAIDRFRYECQHADAFAEITITALGL